MLTEIFQYNFFIYALIGVSLISISSALIGTYIVSRRLVAISGGVTHACFGGLGLGYFLGVSPLVTAAVFAIAASVGVEAMSSKFRLREDSAIAVIWAVGMAVGVLFVFLTPGYVPELNTFLFDNILTVTKGDLITFAVFTTLLLVFYIWKFKTITACAFDRDFARVEGLPVRFVTYTMTVFVAACIVLTIRLVGIMLLMSMMSLPMMTAEVFSHRLKVLIPLSSAISLLACFAGLMTGAAIDVPCSAIIVIILAAAFILSKTVMSILSARRKCVTL